MDAAWTSELQPITRDRWTELVSAYPAGTSSWEVRRHHVRHRVHVSASVCFTIEHLGKESTTRVPCSVENASVSGLMLHSDVAIAPHTSLELQVYLDEEIVRLSGWVVHTTGTINGVKIGTHLHFDETSCVTRRERQTIAAAYSGDEARVMAVAPRATVAPEPSKGRRLLARVFSGASVGFSVEKLLILGGVAAVSYVIGSMILPTLAR